MMFLAIFDPRGYLVEVLTNRLKVCYNDISKVISSQKPNTKSLKNKQGGCHEKERGNRNGFGGASRYFLLCLQ
jgi:hypothetical protein